MASILTPAIVYSLRETNILALPKSVQDVIASLQLGPVQQGFVKKPKFQKAPHTGRNDHRRNSHASAGSGAPARADSSANWREAAVSAVRQRIREVDDPDYAEIFAIFNKLSKMNYEKLSTQVFEFIKKRESDSVFRLRIVTLIFSKGTENALFSPLFATLMFDLNAKHTEVVEDLKTVCNIDTWKALYAEDVILLPSSTDPTFDEMVIKWTKQKDRRRGFSRFMIELYLRNMIEAEIVATAIQTTLDDLKECISASKTLAIEEYVNQLSTFVYDTARMLKGKPITAPIKNVTDEIVKNAKTYSCLPMRSKFKLEDAYNML